MKAMLTLTMGEMTCDGCRLRNYKGALPYCNLYDRYMDVPDSAGRSARFDQCLAEFGTTERQG